jgi:predicted RNA-binding Zn ribbon-like protein
VNTVSWRGRADRSLDHLRSDEDCLRWAERAGVVTADEALRIPATDGRLLASLTGFRDVVAEVVTGPGTVARIGDTRSAEQAADAQAVLDPAATAAVVDAFAHAELIGTGGRRRWRIAVLDERLITRRLALELEWLLTSDPGRIGRCGDDDCGWVFLDTSRGQNRRWCRSADCGNRHRVREHHRRRTELSRGSAGA